MFFDGLSKKYNIDIMSTDVSLHSGIPKQRYDALSIIKILNHYNI